MRCNACDGVKFKVTDTRKQSNNILRRRVCLNCQTPLKTIEIEQSEHDKMTTQIKSLKRGINALEKIVTKY